MHFLALGVDKNDYIIKRRMIQSIEFITDGFVTAAVLRDIGLPQIELPTALLFFNVGVEMMIQRVVGFWA